MFIRSLNFMFACSTLVACATALTPTPTEDFFSDISSYCGNSYAGKLVSTDEVDADFAAENIVMHVRDCSESEVRIPLHVGENRSRTWVLSRDQDGLELRHDHRHEDGVEDAVSQYGGFSRTETSTQTRMEFPADVQTKAIFDTNDISVSNQNVWAVEVHPEDDLFAYEMSRPNRFFRIEFDLAAPVETPPPAWGHE